eukprot:scaffold31861_cov38-Phaeocystis_antarctica.AAC.2
MTCASLHGFPSNHTLAHAIVISQKWIWLVGWSRLIPAKKAPSESYRSHHHPLGGRDLCHPGGGLGHVIDGLLGVDAVRTADGVEDAWLGLGLELGLGLS